MKYKPFYKTQAEFEEAYKDLVSRWSESGRSWLYDANCIGINEQWVADRISHCDTLAIFKVMISKLVEQRCKLRTGLYEYEWDVEGLLQKYRDYFRREIQKIERDYLED